jgi:hypothetical protein
MLGDAANSAKIDALEAGMKKAFDDLDISKAVNDDMRLTMAEAKLNAALAAAPHNKNLFSDNAAIQGFIDTVQIESNGDVTFDSTAYKQAASQLASE